MFPLGILKATGSVFKTDFTALPSIDTAGHRQAKLQVCLHTT
jgi:hypothetical protein